MAQSACLLSRIVACSITATERAGKIIKDVMIRGSLNIIEKGKDDIQTEADRCSQRCIITSLSRHFPNVTIIGEEELPECEVSSDWIITEENQEVLKLKLPPSLENIDPKDVCIWVDPLDGTSEYASHLLEHVTILVGVAVGQKAIGGIIHQPYYKNTAQEAEGRTLWAINGVGFGGFTPVLPPEGKRIITTTRSHSDSNVQDAINGLAPNEVLRVGGAGYKVILLMEGKAHAYVFASKGCKRWDTCAPEAILHAVGGKLTDIHGEQYSYNAKTTYLNESGVLATAPGQVHEWYVKHIPYEVKQRLGQ